jgi:ESF2/ABP1 family protein
MVNPTQQNKWLEAESNDSGDEPGYQSDADERSKGALPRSRPTKRRRLSEDSDVGSDAGQNHISNKREDESHVPGTIGEDQAHTRLTLEDSRNGTSLQDEVSTPKQPRNSSTLTSKKVDTSRKGGTKSGIVYISRVPPFMKPSTVRQLLEPYGEIGRIFLTPEDPTQHTKRVKSGGNKKRSFVDGWVEFLSKKDAKVAAETLNATIIGGKKGGWYHDDIWNMKYLRSGFKWSHLTEQIANENAERAARLRAEIAQTTRENKAFLQNVERAKMLEGMESKQTRKRKASHHQQGDGVLDDADAGEATRRNIIHRDFRQNEVKSAAARSKVDEKQPNEVQRVLNKIF